MTTLRPERPADDPMSYEDTGQFAAVVQRLADPLNDPLPGRPPAVPEEQAADQSGADPAGPTDPVEQVPRARQATHARQAPVGPQAPAVRVPSPAPVAPPAPPPPPVRSAPAAGPEVRDTPFTPAAAPGLSFYASSAGTDLPSAPSAASPWSLAPEPGQGAPSPALAPSSPSSPSSPPPLSPPPSAGRHASPAPQFLRPEAFVRPEALVPPEPVAAPEPVPPAPPVRPVPPAPAENLAADFAADVAETTRLPVLQLPLPPLETVREPVSDSVSQPVSQPVPETAAAPATAPAPVAEPVADPEATAVIPVLSLDEPLLVPPADGGRAARRKAAKQGGGHRARGRNPGAPAGADAAGTLAAESAAVPMSRVEARRAAKAAKDSPAVVISRVVGELFITTGVVMLLFVTYQLWWTNVRAHEQADSASQKLEQQWSTGQDDPSPAVSSFDPGEGFAIMYIPKLDVKAPIAQGTDTDKVLNKGMIGHYDGALNTAMPWDATGNFAVAAHRNTHGEPFRYINHLVPGDKVVVQTSTTYYTYEITSSLASTPPSNVSVLDPIPVGSGFTQPGRYLTLTTCTPEFTSTNRLIVWGKLVEEQPSSEGEPAALAGG